MSPFFYANVADFVAFDRGRPPLVLCRVRVASCDGLIVYK
jgi:hypothetical protein